MVRIWQIVATLFCVFGAMFFGTLFAVLERLTPAAAKTNGTKSAGKAAIVTPVLTSEEPEDERKETEEEMVEQLKRRRSIAFEQEHSLEERVEGMYGSEWTKTPGESSQPVS